MQPSDLKAGMTFEMDGAIYLVIEKTLRQQPRLAAVINARLKNIETGQVIEKRFNAGDKLGEAFIDKKEMQYLYNDGNLYYFMDMETYEQMPIDYETAKDALKYITENMMVTVSTYKGRVLFVNVPLFVDLQIVECEPAVAGDTAKNAYKPATMETGLIVKVPLFIDNGERIRIDTRDGSYVERVK